MSKWKADEPVTWEKMVSAEPRLAKLRAKSQATERVLWATRENGEVGLRGYRAAGVYVNEIKPALLHLVGWFRKAGPAFLQTSDAYSLAIETIYGALPDDFTDDEIEEAWECAYDAELAEGEEIVVAGPAAA